MERIEGPVHGHYLAVYTVASPDGHYGYAKVCPLEPASVWETGSVLFKVAAGPCSSEALALAQVIAKAVEELRKPSELHLWDFAFA